MRTLLLTVMLVACSSSNNNGQPDLAMQEVRDLSTTTADLSPACSTNPMTHVEILNACTSADSVDKTPFYPTLAPNGQLPPLP